eukprot:Hpha_TRINITY_DN15152_c3_g6::TRINITY_DN15152_c3_g6_i1::g.127258::m.127258
MSEEHQDSAPPPAPEDVALPPMMGDEDEPPPPPPAAVPSPEVEGVEGVEGVEAQEDGAEGLEGVAITTEQLGENNEDAGETVEEGLAPLEAQPTFPLHEGVRRLLLNDRTLPASKAGQEALDQFFATGEVTDHLVDFAVHHLPESTEGEEAEEEVKACHVAVEVLACRQKHLIGRLSEDWFLLDRLLTALVESRTPKMPAWQSVGISVTLTFLASTFDRVRDILASRGIGSGVLYEQCRNNRDHQPDPLPLPHFDAMDGEFVSPVQMSAGAPGTESVGIKTVMHAAAGALEVPPELPEVEGVEQGKGQSDDDLVAETPETSVSFGRGPFPVAPADEPVWGTGPWAVCCSRLLSCVDRPGLPDLLYLVGQSRVWSDYGVYFLRDIADIIAQSDVVSGDAESDSLLWYVFQLLKEGFKVWPWPTESYDELACPRMEISSSFSDREEKINACFPSLGRGSSVLFDAVVAPAVEVMIQHFRSNPRSAVFLEGCRFLTSLVDRYLGSFLDGSPLKRQLYFALGISGPLRRVFECLGLPNTLPPMQVCWEKEGLRPPLGLCRLEVVRLACITVQHLARHSELGVNLELTGLVRISNAVVESKAIENMLELFATYDMCNILHCLVADALVELVKLDAGLRKEPGVELPIKLPSQEIPLHKYFLDMADAWKEGRPKGYFGHVMRITESVLTNTSFQEPADAARWEAFMSSTFSEERTREKTELADIPDPVPPAPPDPVTDHSAETHWPEGAWTDEQGKEHTAPEGEGVFSNPFASVKAQYADPHAGDGASARSASTGSDRMSKYGIDTSKPVHKYTAYALRQDDMAGGANDREEMQGMFADLGAGALMTDLSKVLSKPFTNLGSAAEADLGSGGVHGEFTDIGAFEDQAQKPEGQGDGMEFSDLGFGGAAGGAARVSDFEFTDFSTAAPADGGGEKRNFEFTEFPATQQIPPWKAQGEAHENEAGEQIGFSDLGFGGLRAEGETEVEFTNLGPSPQGAMRGGDAGVVVEEDALEFTDLSAVPQE